jgi:SAM-dependent methyltransferase
MASLDPYVNIDGQPEPRRFARLLELRGAQPHQARLRRAFVGFAGIRPGWRVLDVGCGTGIVTRDLRARVGPTGRVVGVDPSRAFIREARRRASAEPRGRCTFRVADGRGLPFPTASFDAAVAVTVLLHVTASDRVLAEMMRVTRSGGYVAVLDQDLGTLAIDLPDRALTRRIVDAHADRIYANPWSGRTLLRRFRTVGLRRVRGRAFVVVDRGYDSYVRSILERRVELTTSWRVITAAEGRRWLESADAAGGRGEFFMSLNYYAVVGVRP